MGHNVPNTDLALRIASFSMLMMAYLVFEFYTADLISLMASPPKLSTIKTFEELLNGEYKLIVWAETNEDQYLKSAPVGSLERLAYDTHIRGNPGK